MKDIEAVACAEVRLRRLALCIALAVATSACSDDEPSTASTTTTGEDPTTTEPITTVPERPSSTTTTAFDPATVEGQVEAAYLKSWDVYAEAVYNLELDEQAFAEVYAEDGLVNVINDVRSRIEDGRAALVEVEHDYDIVMTSDALASVIDNLTNHQVLIDPESKEIVEEDPNEVQLLNFVVERIDEEWRVTLVERLTP